MANEQTSAEPGVSKPVFDVAGGMRCREDVAQRRGYSDRSNAERGQAFSSDWNDPPPLRYGAASSRRFDDWRLGLVGDQLVQERNETEGSET
jgi:hypothetical protein